MMRSIAVFSGAACCPRTVRAVHPLALRPGTEAGRWSASFSAAGAAPAAQAALQLNSGAAPTEDEEQARDGGEADESRYNPEDVETIDNVFFVPLQTYTSREQGELINLWEKHVASADTTIYKKNGLLLSPLNPRGKIRCGE